MYGDRNIEYGWIFLYLSLMHTDKRIGKFFITDITCFLQLFVNRLDVCIEIRYSQSFPAFRTLCTLIIMHLEKGRSIFIFER